MSTIIADITSRMSARLLAVADMLGSNRYRCVADVGCDHGYVSICLVQRETTVRAIAMDVREGPLSRAEENIRQLGLSDRIEIRLSDGLQGLREGEADGLVIAGMGGKLIMSILEHSDATALGIRTAVLQPQSDLFQFREYLGIKDYSILDERVIFDDGKYYFPMLVSFDREKRCDGPYKEAIRGIRKRIADIVPENELDTTLTRLCRRYGAINIFRAGRMFGSYLEHEREVAVTVISEIDKKRHPARYTELEKEIKDIELLI